MEGVAAEKKRKIRHKNKKPFIFQRKKKVECLNLGKGEELAHQGGAGGRAARFPQLDELDEETRGSVLDAFLQRGSGISHWEENVKKTR